MKTGDQKEDERRGEIGEISAETAGAVVGGLVGLVGGPAGVVGGAVLGVAMQRAVGAVIGRMTKVEERRVTEAIHGIAEASELLAADGHELRDDEFFTNEGGRRPPADDLLEGVLRQAAETFEERKVPLLASLYAGVSHDASIPSADAMYLLRVAGQLTFRQFVALAAIASRDEHNRALASAKGRQESGLAVPDAAVVMELDDLGDRRLVGVRSKGRVISPGAAYESGTSLSTAQVGYGALALLPAGEMLVALTGVKQRIGLEEQAAWVDVLRGRPVEM
jgi:hypothetical protein